MVLGLGCGPLRKWVDTKTVKVTDPTLESDQLLIVRSPLDCLQRRTLRIKLVRHPLLHLVGVDVHFAIDKLEDGHVVEVYSFRSNPRSFRFSPRLNHEAISVPAPVQGCFELKGQLRLAQPSRPLSQKMLKDLPLRNKLAQE